MRSAVLVLLAAAGLAAFLLTRSCATGEAPPTAPAAAPKSEDATPSPPRARVRPGEGRVAPEPPPVAVPPAGVEAVVEEAKPKLHIRGRVIDGFNVGVPAAEVEIRAWSGEETSREAYTVIATTGLDGAFEVVVDRHRASAGFGIATTAKGHVEGWKAVKLEAYNETRGIDIVVEPARAIVGRVIDGDARAIPGTTVQLWYGSETTWPTDVDAEGRFKTPPHAPRRAFELVVQAPGHPSRSIPIAASTEDVTDVGDIVFRRGGRVAGVVVDARGSPVQDLWLVVVQIADPKNRPPRVKTDTAGRFEFEDLSEGRITIHVDEPTEGGPAGARREYRGGISDVEVGRDDVRVEVRSQTTIWLKFVDADTRRPVDVKKAEYGLRYEGDPEPERLGHGASGSDPLISTVLSAASGRRYDLTVRAPGFEDARVNGIDVGEVTEMAIDVPMRRKL